MTLLESLNLSLGASAQDFSLQGIDGKTYTLGSFVDKKVLILVFMCNHCPYVQPLWRRWNDLQAKFGERGVQLVGINPNTANIEYEDETMEKMKEYAEEFEMNFPYLEDVNQSVAKAYQAQCTPDIYVFDEKRELTYHGRVDDNFRDPEAVTREELAEAIEALLVGEKPAEEQNPSMGCSIKWV
jgi:peroxiredoxin